PSWSNHCTLACPTRAEGHGAATGARRWAMTSRRERLHRLRTGFQCHASWEEMAGDERRRHCAACRRDVLDVAQLSPREIAAHLQASRGDLCGRVTRRGDRLVM